LIKFKSISYKNILSVGNVPVELDFTKNNITLILGINGDGKSTLIEAIYYGLYGKSFRGLTLPEIVNSTNKKNLVVDVSFDIGTKSYRVVRGTKPSVFEIYVDGVLREPPASLKEYQKWFSSAILKMDDTTFRQIVVLGSTDYVPFMKLSTPDRRNVIEELLDIQIFSIMNTVIKGMIKDSKAETLTFGQSLSTTESLIGAKESHLSDMNANQDSHILGINTKLATLSAQTDDLESDVSSCQKEVESLLGDIVGDKSKLEETRRKGNTVVAKMGARISDNESKMRFYSENDVCPTCAMEIPLDAKEDIVHDCSTTIEGLKEKSEQANTHISKITEQIDGISIVQSSIHKKESEISLAQREISSLGRQSDALKAELLALENKEDDNTEPLTNEIKTLNVKLVSLSASIKELESKSRYMQHCYAMLKDTGVKSIIIKTYIPIINSLIKKFLEVMDFSVSFVFDENFNEIIKMNHRDVYSYKNLSDGQKMRINLVLLFVFREVARLKNSAATSILILDEIGSSTMDVEGMQAFNRIIRETSKASNVFIISHDEKLQDEYTNQILFERVNKMTRMVEK